MAIDITNQEQLRKLTLQDLVNDAVERKDKDALRWLEDESGKEVPVKDKEGNPTGKMKPNPLISYRAVYLEKFCGYKKADNKVYSEAAKAAAKAKREAEKKDMFAKAFAQL